MTTDAIAKKPAKRPRPAEMTLLRLIPGNSLVHRLWAGTKLVVAAILALMVSVSPEWPMIGVAVGVVLIGMLVARVPLSVFPPIPMWFIWLLLLGAVTSTWSGAKPVVDVGPMHVSLGGLDDWARITALALTLIAAGALIGWTTPLGEIAPAVNRLFRPLRWLRLPVDEWIMAIALAIRCLPLLIDEIRMLIAARRLRKRDEEEINATWRALLEEAHDLLATAIVISLRRARDLADAMISRGGAHGAVSASTARARFVDWVVMVAVVALCGAAFAVVHL